MESSWLKYDDDFDKLVKSNGFKVKGLTLYDHWLNNQEAEMIINYPRVNDDLGLDVYLAEELKFTNTFKLIFENTVLQYIDKDTLTCKEVETSELIVDYVRAACREESFVDLVIPKYEIVVVPTYDMVFHILCKKELPGWLENIASENDLFLLTE